MKYLALSIFVCFSIQAYSQCTYETNVPDELYRGRYQPVGAWLEHPFTMFNKRKQGWVLNGELTKITDNIIHAELGDDNAATGYALLYKSIYNSAKDPEPSKCAYDQSNCPHPLWVKANAFINLVNLKYERVGGRDTFYTLSPAEREWFGWRANEGLRNLNPSVIGCVNISSWGCTEIAHVSFNLLFYLQAYDLLKTSGYITGDVRQNIDCSPRSKLREFSRNLYKESNGVINSFWGMKRNHGIICASVLGMAAIVLWDAGTETSVKSFLSGWLDGSGSVWPRPKYNPNKWMARALGTGGYTVFGEGEDGLEDNFFTGSHWWGAKDAPMTSADGKAGFAEGPGYCVYMLTAFAPFLRTQANFSAPAKNPLLNDSRYQEILDWNLNILNQDEAVPTYDNTSVGSQNILGILGEDRWPGKPTDSRFYADYILANGAEGTIKSASPVLQPAYFNKTSGNGVLRQTDKNNNLHALHLLAETGKAVAPSGRLPSHDDDDGGSFSIFANGQQLAIDPPYMGWGTHAITNKNYHHNITAPRGSGPGEVTDFRSENNGFSVDLSYNSNYDAVTRTIKTYQTNGMVYYAMHDRCTAIGLTVSFELKLNGNGVGYDNTFIQTGQSTDTLTVSGGRVFKWDHPCKRLAEKWGLLAHAAVINPGAETYFTNYTGEDYVHGSGGDASSPIGSDQAITKAEGFKYKNAFPEIDPPKKTDRPYGTHNRMLIAQDNTANALFQTVMVPYKCGVDSLPLFSRLETSRSTTTFLQFIYPLDTVINVPYLAKKPPSTLVDTITDVHLSHNDIDTSTITLPASGNAVYADAERAFFSVGMLQIERPGACSPSIIRFKKAEIANGTELKFNDTPYISTPYPVSAYYEHTGKFRYKGFVITAYGANITFRMPDLEPGYAMQCVNGSQVLPSAHYTAAGPDSVKLITVTFPAGTTNFTLELADPCAASCFFPPTDLPIDSIFVFDTGAKEALDHDLDVIPGGGEFRILKGSKVSVCPDFMLRNQDSLILHALDDEANFVHQNPMDGASTISTPVRNRMASTRSMIIVNNKAALVLDSGSYTHVGDNATILVLKGGTLLVRKGATLEIGGKESTNRKMFGEVIAEEGAFVCIEDSSSIYFYADTPTVDTQDVNVFYVSLNAYAPTIAGTNPQGARGRFIEPGAEGTEPPPDYAGMYAGSNCIAFCDVKLHMPPHGVNNRSFGWCNFSSPVARLSLPDYTCQGTPVTLNSNGVLNETRYWLKVDADTGTVINQSGVAPASRFTTVTLPALGYGKAYSIRLVVENDCGERDTLNTSIAVPSAPVPHFTLTSTGCQGTGVVTANGLLSAGNGPTIPHVWFVQQLDTARIDTLTGVLGTDYQAEWVNDTATGVDSVFHFPGFNWKGGYSYVIGLTIKGLCSDSTVTDTVHFPLRVDIVKDTLKIYPGITGYASKVINSFAYSYDTFYWQPATGLSNASTLNPTAMPSATTQYTLVAELGGCVVKDSVIVRVLNCPWAGDDKTICEGDSAMIGIYNPCSPPFYTSCYVCWGIMVWDEDSGIMDRNLPFQYVKPQTTTVYTLKLLVWSEAEFGVYDTVDYDKVTITVIPRDTPSFDLAYQPDSLTFTFSNTSAGYNEVTYFWTFGDGDSSRLNHPTHTFPYYDSSYLVCLYATGICDTLAYCDTLKPNINNYGSFGKRGNVIRSKEPDGIVTPGNPAINLLGSNRPNPFDETTLIDYELVPDFKSAQLIITNTLGQKMQVITIHNTKGTIKLDASRLQSGIYYYTLFVDERRESSRMMVVK